MIFFALDSRSPYRVQAENLAFLLKCTGHLPSGRYFGFQLTLTASCIPCGISNLTTSHPLFLTSRWQNKLFFKQILGVGRQICLKNNLFCIILRGIETYFSIPPITQKDLGLKSLELDIVVTLELPPGERITKRPFSSAYLAAPPASSSWGSQRKATPP